MTIFVTISACYDLIAVGVGIENAIYYCMKIEINMNDALESMVYFALE